MAMTTSTCRPIPLVAVLALVGWGVTPAAEPSLDAAAPLRAVAEVYRALPAYADHGELVVTRTVHGRPERRSAVLPLEFVRPNRLVFDAGVLALWCDEKSTHLIGFSRKRALVLPPATALRVDPERTTEDVIEGGNALVGARRFFDDTSDPDQAMAAIGSLPTSIILTMLMETDPVVTLAGRAKAVRRVEDRRLDDGVVAQVVRIDSRDGPDLLLAIDPKSHLIRRIDLAFTADDATMIAWTAGAVESDPKTVSRIFEEHVKALIRRRDRAGIADPGGHRGSVRNGAAVVPTPSGKSIASQIKALFWSK
jgi:hypothetical protein